MATAGFILQALNDKVVSGDIDIASDFDVGAGQVQVFAGATKAAGIDAAVVVGFARAVAGLSAGVEAASGAAAGARC